MIGTRQAAAILGVRPSTLSKAVWDNRLAPPTRGPGGAYIWTEADLRRAAWVLLKRDLGLDELAIAKEAGVGSHS
ncbi:MAG: hypothetical protein BIFFINMI_03301 [Phycisphaerae bacterium]|nr:hypothetical protein [Phycisphaerae bacterium]